MSVVRDKAEQPAFVLLQPLGVVCRSKGSRGSRDLRTDNSAQGWPQVLERRLESLWGKPPAPPGPWLAPRPDQHVLLDCCSYLVPRGPWRAQSLERSIPGTRLHQIPTPGQYSILTAANSLLLIPSASRKESFLFSSSKRAGCHPRGIPWRPVPGGVHKGRGVQSSPRFRALGLFSFQPLSLLQMANSAGGRTTSSQKVRAHPSPPLSS